MLLDAPGLGKTLQAAEAATLPVVVSCPTYLVEQWRDFINEQYPGIVAAAAYGTQYKRYKTIISKWDYLIINHEMFRTYEIPPANTLIIDESHHMRGRTAQQSRVCQVYASNTPNVFELTGTPIVKTSDDFFMQLRILYPKIFTSYNNFVARWCRVSNGPFGARVVGTLDPEAFRRMLTQYAIGRSYKEVGLQLPDLIESTIRVTFPPKLEALYKSTKEQYRMVDLTFQNAPQVMAALRQVTVCREKIDSVINILMDSRSNGESTVVFCWYRDSAEILGTILKCPYITGEQVAAERVKIAKAGHPIVVATIASLSEGVDLSHARRVVFFEEDYTPGIMTQALARVRRYSANEDPVRAYYIHMKGSIDESIHKLVTARHYDARAILKDALK